MFVCQCEEDYKLMHRLFSDTNEALGRKVAINTWFRPRNEPLPPPPMSDAEVRVMSKFIRAFYITFFLSEAT